MHKKDKYKYKHNYTKKQIQIQTPTCHPSNLGEDVISADQRSQIWEKIYGKIGQGYKLDWIAARYPSAPESALTWPQTLVCATMLFEFWSSFSIKSRSIVWWIEYSLICLLPNLTKNSWIERGEKLPLWHCLLPKFYRFWSKTLEWGGGVPSVLSSVAAAAAALGKVRMLSVCPVSASGTWGFYRTA